MNCHGTKMLAVIGCLVATAGCSMAPPDPLVVAANGDLRLTVTLEEIIAEDIPFGCDESLFEAEVDEARIPVEDSSLELVSAQGIALCVEEASLVEYDIEGSTGLDGNRAIQQASDSGQTLGSGELGQSDSAESEGNPDTQPGSVPLSPNGDPTPQPIDE